MKRLMLMLPLSMAVGCVCGQSPIKMEYDAAGNRVLRVQSSEYYSPQDDVSDFWESMEIDNLGRGVYTFTCLHYDVNEITQIGVYDINGYKVLSPRFEGNTMKVDLSNQYRREVYILRCVFRGQLYSYSFVLK